MAETFRCANCGKANVHPGWNHTSEPYVCKHCGVMGLLPESQEEVKIPTPILVVGIILFVLLILVALVS